MDSFRRSFHSAGRPAFCKKQMGGRTVASIGSLFHGQPTIEEPYMFIFCLNQACETLLLGVRHDATLGVYIATILVDDQPTGRTFHFIHLE